VLLLRLFAILLVVLLDTLDVCWDELLLASLCDVTDETYIVAIAAKAIKVGVALILFAIRKKAIYWQDKNGNTANNNHLKPNASSAINIISKQC
jgi:hypothetical protein